MSSSEKLLKTLSSLIENGILTSIPYSWVNNLPNGIEFTKWRTNVCFIGESYDGFPITESMKACRNCDLLLIIGTAGIIPTPKWLAEESRKSGATIVNINPHPGSLDDASDYIFRGRAEEYLKS